LNRIGAGPEERMTNLIVTVITFLLLLVCIGLFLKYIQKKAPILCLYCPAPVQPLADLTADDQKLILDYFRQHEHRVAPADEILVCPHCHVVYDDFVPLKSFRWLGIDDTMVYGGTGMVLQVYGGTCLGFCKQCGEYLQQEATHSTEIGEVSTQTAVCRKCSARYSWRPWPESGYLFLTPLDDTRILAQGPLLPGM
jgi:hypothetical protein